MIPTAHVSRTLRHASWLLALCLLLTTTGCRLIMPPTPEPVVLRVAYREHTVALKPLLDAYQRENPEITIEVVELPRYGNAELNRALENDDVDVILSDRGILSHVRAGRLLPLQDLLGEDWYGIYDDYYNGAWEGLQVQGAQYGIPAGLDTFALYLNLDATEALGLTPPEPDWTTFDLLSLAVNLNYPDGAPGSDLGPIYGFCTAWDDYDPIVFTYLLGGRIADDVNTPSEPTLDEMATIEAVKWYTDLFTTYQVAPKRQVISAFFPQGIQQAAAEGSCGVWTGWFSDRGGMDTPELWPMTWLMLPMPADRTPITLADVEGYYVAASCEYPLEALALIRELADHPEASGQKLPPRRSLVMDERYALEVGQDVATVASQFPSEMVILPTEISPSLEKVGMAFLGAIQQIIEHGVDPESALVAAQDQVRYAFDNP